MNMKKLIPIFLLLFSINSYCEVLNLECTSVSGNHKRTLVIDTDLKTIYIPYSKNTYKLQITPNEFKWIETYSDGYSENSINRFTGIETTKSYGGFGGSPVPYKCEVLKNRKF